MSSNDTNIVLQEMLIYVKKVQLKKARCLIIGFLLILICNESPYYLMTPANINPNWRCQTTNLIYAQYRSYFTTLTLSTIIPLITIILFGYLTYRNLHTLNVDDQYRLSALSKQTIKMVLYEIFIILFFEFPYVISQIYSISTINISKSLYRQIQEQFATVFFFIYAYIISFYCYCLASKRFRKQILDLFQRFKFNRRPNQIIPVSQTVRVIVLQQTTPI